MKRLLTAGVLGAFAFATAPVALASPFTGSVGSELLSRSPINFSLEMKRRIINATPHPEDAPLGPLILDDYSDGLRVVHTRNVTLTEDFSRDLHFVNPIMGQIPNVGISPVVGAQYVSDRHVSDRQSAYAVHAHSLPMHAGDLADWQEGDSVSFAASGGVYFGIGVGSNTISVGVGYLAEGYWSVYVGKPSRDEAYVQINRGKLKGFSGYVGNAFMSYELGQFKNKDQSFSFTYDLRNAEAAKAYEDAVRGNLAPSEEMALRTAITGVIHEESTHSRATSRVATLSVGLPFLLNATTSEGMSHEVIDSIYHSDGSRSNAEYGVYSYGDSEELPWNAYDRTKSFTSVDYINTDDESGDSYRDYFGQFSWSWEEDHTNGSKIEEAMDELVELTGITELKLEVPRNSKMRFASFNFNLTIPRETTDALMDLATSDEINGRAQRNRIRLAGVSMARDWMYLHPRAYAARTSRRGAVTSNRWLSDETDGAIVQMFKALKVMDENRSDRTRFVKAYAKFGRAMLRNEFTFATAAEMLRGQQVGFDYTVEGERISHYERSWEHSGVPQDLQKYLH